MQTEPKRGVISSLDLPAHGQGPSSPIVRRALKRRQDETRHRRQANKTRAKLAGYGKANLERREEAHIGHR